ncbi:MAG TPA: hypothetical protein VJG90_00625 [Candidatus Nanoarchaeia archaeon]|nr:hypothetical protein [Candidatus Nanoarchaeia archaeon]
MSFRFSDFPESKENEISFFRTNPKLENVLALLYAKASTPIFGEDLPRNKKQLLAQYKAL